MKKSKNNPKKKNNIKSDRVCKLVCPKCHAHWADLNYRYSAIIKASDVKVLEGTPFKDGDELKCRKCNYVYTSWDIWIAIASPSEAAKGQIISGKDENIKDEIK